MLNEVIGFFMGNLIEVVAVYVAIGMLYTFVKWTLSLLKLRRQVIDISEEDVSKYVSRYKGTPENARQTLIMDATRSIFGVPSSYPPRAREHWSTLLYWAVLWPFNLIYTLFHDVLTEVFSFVQRRLAWLYDMISEAILPK